MAHMTVHAQKYPERFVKLGSHEILFEYKNDTLYISPKEQLKPYPQKLTDRLLQYAESHPHRVFAAKRDANGEWIELTYAETANRAWRIAQSLKKYTHLSDDRPIVILSGNDLEHLTLSMGAMLAGIPFSAISPAYSLISKDFGKLKHIFDVLTPGLVFANDGDAFATAIETWLNDIAMILACCLILAEFLVGIYLFFSVFFPRARGHGFLLPFLHFPWEVKFRFF